MRKLLANVLLTSFGLALSGCASNGAAVKPVVCPALPPLPATLMNSPSFGTQIRGVLLESGTPPTHGSEDSKPPAR